MKHMDLMHSAQQWRPKHTDQRLRDCTAMKAAINSRDQRLLRIRSSDTISSLKENKFLLFLITYIENIYIDELFIFRNKQLLL